MTLSRLAKGMLLAVALLTGPTVAFAQVSAITDGVTRTATESGLTITDCSGSDCLVKIIGNVVRLMIQLSGVLLLCYLLYAGFLYITANGESKNIDKAQSMIKNAVAGLLLIVVSFAIASFVLDQVGNVVTGGEPTAPAGAGGGAGAPAPATPPPPTATP